MLIWSLRCFSIASIAPRDCTIVLDRQNYSAWVPSPKIENCEDLVLTGWPIGSRGALKLAPVLRRSKRLRSLSMIGMDMRDSGAGVIASALVGLPSLSILHFGRNRIGSPGAISLSNLVSSPRSELRVRLIEMTPRISLIAGSMDSHVTHANDGLLP